MGRELAAHTPRDAGEVLTLRRAALMTATQTLADLQAELGEQCCHGRGVREAGRLLASVRAHVSGDAAEIVRLLVAPGRQGRGIGTRLMLAAEDLPRQPRHATLLFTGLHSHTNLRLYRRDGCLQTHTTQVRAYPLVHLVNDQPRIPGSASSRPGCS